jgi:hypothetical protein
MNILYRGDIMWSFLFFIGILVLAFLVSRNNYKKRSLSLMDNLQSFAEYLKECYYSLSISHQQNFINSLTEKDKSYFQLLITDKITYKLNTWSINQHMMKQEELMLHLKKLKKQ